MATDIKQRGFFSVLRWRSDTTRDEARNVAVLLVEPEGRFGGIKAAPLSTISPRLHEQGLLDAMLVGLENQFADETKPKLKDLKRMHASLQHSLYVTEPQPVSVPDVHSVLEALYRAYAAPRGGGARLPTKGFVLDRLVRSLRNRGVHVRRGHYVGDFIFDAVIDAPPNQPSLIEVLSFATARKDWTPAEHDAGHFLYALEQLERKGMVAIRPPTETSHESALAAYERVQKWFKKADVPTVDPEEVAEVVAPGQTQLPLEAAAPR